LYELIFFCIFVKKMNKNKDNIINTIVSEMQSMMLEEPPKDKEVFLSYISAIICQFDTDIAISVMDNFGAEGKQQSLSIKVNYGY
jgi:hypothetical protein